jgi:hypothetical protein
MTEQNWSAKLEATVNEGKQKLDVALANAENLGMDEAMALDYVQLIQIVRASAPINLHTDNSHLYDIYEQYRPPGVDPMGVNIPDPVSWITVKKLRALTSAIYYEGAADQFLERWSKGFARVVAKAAQLLVALSVILP